MRLLFTKTDQYYFIVEDVTPGLDSWLWIIWYTCELNIQKLDPLPTIEVPVDIDWIMEDLNTSIW